MKRVSQEYQIYAFTRPKKIVGEAAAVNWIQSRSKTINADEEMRIIILRASYDVLSQFVETSGKRYSNLD